MLRFHPAALILASLPFALLTSILPRAQAQAVPPAIKTYSIDAFGAVTGANPKYGVTTREIGLTAGADLTRHLHLFDIALEGRYTTITGFSADEKTFGGGLKVSRAYNRLHPYLDFLVEGGLIHFDHPFLYSNDGSYTHDGSIVYAYGGGIDYDVLRNFALKVDFQGSRWRLGKEAQAFNPYNGSVGIVYTIPFKGLRGR